MIAREQLIAIGRFNKPHGVKGEISATLELDPSLLSRFRCLVTDIDGIFTPFFVEQNRPKNDVTTLLHIDGVDNDQQAALLVNHDIYVLKDDFGALSAEEQSDAYPLDFFIGFTLKGTDGAVVGTIDEVDDTTANVLFVVTRAAGEAVMVPAAEELIEELDVDRKTIVMDLPHGLLEI